MSTVLTPTDGLVHLGVLYDGVDDLVGRALPEIRAVLDEGGDVRVTVERSGVRELRRALGDDAERVDFPSPLASYAAAAPDYLARMRRELPRDRRTLIVGQYSVLAPPTWDSAHAEDAVNLVLGDLPLTVLCACASDGPPDHRALVERSHPRLLDADGRRANAAFRAPDPASPASLAPWGPPAATLTVSDPAGLAELRARVGAVTAQAGLGRPARDAAVLAAHEAVLLAATEDPDAAVPLRGEHRVDVHVAHGVVVTEAHGPRPDRLPARDVVDTDGAAAVGADWRHDLLARFCDRVGVHHGLDGRRVRVVTPGAAGAEQPRRRP